jgi:hypothetical protein
MNISLVIIESPQQGDDLNQFALIKSFYYENERHKTCDLTVMSPEYSEKYFNYAG